MEILYSDTEISDRIIKESLEELFPDLKIFKWDFVSEAPEDYDSGNKNHILFNTTLNKEKIEFGFLIDVYRTPEQHSQERSIEIARTISRKSNSRMLIPYTLPENPQAPYYDLIFDEGEIFLADDADTNFADGTKGKVKILEKVQIEDYEFDKRGNLINKTTTK